MEIWKQIDGYNGKYMISNCGNVKRIYKSGKSRLLNPYIKKTSNNKRYVVHLAIDGKTKEVQIISLVASHFIGKKPDGYIPIHINGVQSDNFVNNIKYVTLKENGLLTGRNSRRRPVVKIDSNGEFVEFYSSARECARNNYMSYQTVIDRCNGKVKSVFAPDGFAYAWDDDDRSLANVIRNIELHNGYMPKAKNIEFDW